MGAWPMAGSAQPAAEPTARAGKWVANLQRFVRNAQTTPDAEYCELCSAALPPEHAHLAEPERHRLLCACQACDFLLGDRLDRKYVRVPKAAKKLDDFRLNEMEWDSLGIPIGLAFLYHSTPDERVLAFYPGPAGPTESLLDLGACLQLVANNPVFADLEPDVEALLVNRVKNPHEYYRAPIDRCYALVGLIRTHWRGVSGGGEAWKAIDGFFAGLAEPRNGAHRHG